MRCIIKTKVGYYKIYFIELRQNSIVGWFSGDWMRDQLGIKNSSIFEVHFTFPKDGNFHHSIKLITKIKEEYITIYWDKVKIKTIAIENEKQPVVINELTREEFKDNILGHLVPLFKPDSMEDIPFFHFTTVGFNIFNGSFKVREGMDLVVEQKDIKSTDLIVDVTNLDRVSLNVSAAIRPKGEVISGTEPSQYWCKIIELSNSRQLILRCFIDPLNDD